MLAAACALGLLASGGCASLHHGRAKKQHCPEPPVTEDIQNMPPIRVPVGLDAPDTRNAIKIPPLTEPQVARGPNAPCLSAPPNFGAPLAAYTSPSGPRAKGSFSWHVNGGAALAMGSSKDYLSSGWTIGGGLTYGRPQKRFALQLDLAYVDFNAARKLFGLDQQKVQYSIDSGKGTVWLISTAGRYTVPFTRNVNAYALLGVGAYHDIYYLWRPFLPDRKDDMVLELAVAARCSHIVTHNLRDFQGAESFGITIVSPLQFMQIFGDEA